ncbi:MAG: hypothetical protein IKH02_09765 [Prevotella sp.]|nr:hypothetical protein [Prevotella sp.]
MKNNRKTYISPKATVIGIKTNPLLSGSNYIKTADKEYDGRVVLSRESQFSNWEEESSEE